VLPKNATLQLRIRTGRHAGATLPIDRPLLLGRDGRCRVVIEDPQISRVHALIEPDRDRLIIRDMGSRNGLFVNGERVDVLHELQDGDVLILGQTELVVEAIGLTPVMRRRATPESESAGTAPGWRDASAQTEAGEIASREVSSVRIANQLLTAALQFAAQCATLTPEKLQSWFLVRIASLLRAQGCLLLAGDPRSAAARGAWCHYGSAEAARLLAQSPWEQGRWGRGLFEPAAVTMPALLHTLSVPAYRGSDVAGLFVFWREDSTAFLPTDVALARALLDALAGGPLLDVMEQFAASATKASPIGDDLGLVGQSAAAVRLREAILRIGPREATTLVTGESGTGKELVARALVAVSPRADKPFFALNMGAIPATLIEAELFGYERGAFSGADQQRHGKLELASGGSIFLDEIGELPLDTQAKLLRALEGQPFFRIGGRAEVRADVRFVCATNRNLEDMVKAGTFRADLFHRINILRIELPPLRERTEDIPHLCEHFIAKITASHNLPEGYRLSPKVLGLFMRHQWPGNIRELRNTIERMILLADGKELSERVAPDAIRALDNANTATPPRLHQLTAEMERDIVMRALIMTEGVKSAAALRLGISRPTLDRKIKAYGLEHLANTRGGEE
jgi:DNA-binding NtrC family response regulator